MQNLYREPPKMLPSRDVGSFSLLDKELRGRKSERV
jgi:hypothetical protein